MAHRLKQERPWRLQGRKREHDRSRMELEMTIVDHNSDCTISIMLIFVIFWSNRAWSRIKADNFLQSFLFLYIVFSVFLNSSVLYNYRLNSGKRKRHNFFVRPNFLFWKIRIKSVNNADYGDISILVQFPWNSNLKLTPKFWNCVGGTNWRRRLYVKMPENV